MPLWKELNIIPILSHPLFIRCNGGYPMAAWKYFDSDGVVTGGQYNTNEGCQPYSIAACDHQVVGHLDPCSGTVSTPKCKTECVARYPKTYKDDKHFGKIKVGRSFILTPPNTTLYLRTKKCTDLQLPQYLTQGVMWY